jgi:hypothetical protein
MHRSAHAGGAFPGGPRDACGAHHPRHRTFTLTFTDEVDPANVNGDTVVLVPTERVNASFLSDLNSPPLSQSRRASMVGLQLSPSGSTITVTPQAELAAGTDYSLLVGKSVQSKGAVALTDANGRTAAFQVDFRTQGPQPRVITTSLPEGNPSLIPPNLRSVSITLDHPVENAALGAVTVTGLNGAQNVTVDSVEVLLDGVTVRATLANGACTPLCATTDYQLNVGTPLRGVEGQDIQEFTLPFRTLDLPDTAGPALVRLPSFQPAQDQVALSFSLREPARGRLRVGGVGGPYTEQFVAFPAAGCTGFQAARECSFSVVASGLDLGPGGTGRTYGALLEVTDDFGNTSVYGEFPLVTLLLPKLRITEVYNNPPGEENTQEFVEIANISDAVAYDLNGMALATVDPLTGNVASQMQLAPYANGTMLLQPGKRAVVGGRAFDPGVVGVSQDAVVVIDASTSRSTLLGGLTSGRSTRKQIALYSGPPDQDAARISFFSAPADIYAPGSTFPEGVSAERLVLTSDDDTAVWCQSRNGPSPGRPNSVEGLSACP